MARRLHSSRCSTRTPLKSVFEEDQMRIFKAWLLAAATVFAVAGVAPAQTTTGTISGHVADSQGLPLPGVTVNATSPNLQGTRTAVTSANGDYVFNNMPSGTYTIAFELSGFDK